ncbi:pyruvate carboxylase subunit A [Exophiala viscosa]|uniref:Pyruvate carboxylase subunit A n=1 Tax=Exophiala viscosa TaxID=2486360 RepID=A0AAN6IFD7_9EURO|nr:pyruvate carboxylase subunit A [Exophiala viscosa]KAI1630470.1 pyruvate carboxylase subunit A [Exophiala viscosa]
MARTGQRSSPDARRISASHSRPPLFVAQLPSGSGSQTINRVLIANRGEIACRIIATCRKLDLTSIAVYAEEDATSRHISEADEAISLGSISQAGGNPFLNVQLLVDVARSVKADAVHPGYGYLSENSTFAEAIRAAGLIFVGPSAQAMSTLGDKRNSKDYLRKNEPRIPLIPGFTGSSQNSADLETAAEAIGFPVMLKASAGGGGKGMRIVRERSKLKDELLRAQSEAQRSFGSSDCILEKYIEEAKHIEIQIVGDSHGNVLSLWERECSVQRRHQKVIEETPSPFLTPQIRKEMSAAAVRIGELLHYEGAGTVEFVVDIRDSSFYFLEVNTRLQVEHPITEEVTGLDVVALQLYAAAGGKFKDLRNLDQIPQQGHAIECRLCAEDPGRDFRPENGTIQLWREATHSTARDVRYETAVQSGATISIYFDPMIAKIVVWAPTRQLAIAKMSKVMANTVCAGVRTNQLFLQSCLLHDSFQNPAYTTSLIPTHLADLLRNPYSSRLKEIFSILSVVPGLVLREGYGNRSTNKPFKHTRRAFRTQHFDPVNLDTTITKVVDATLAQQPVLSVWNASQTRSASTYTVSLIPMTTNEDSTEQKSTAKNSAAHEVSRQYNAVSNLLRNGAVTRAPTHEVCLRQWQSLSNQDVGSWRTASAELVIDQSKIHAFIATNASSTYERSSSKAEAQRILCHLPALGTYIEYEAHSLLSYHESLREEVASTVGSAASKTVKAPMPCKVLSVLKQKGDQVKAGEVVMVIESMKMETNISIAAEGTFQTSIKEGDAVDDGKVLCWVE